MKLLIDENIGQSVINFLQKQKYNILIAKKEFFNRDDDYLLNKAYKEKRVVITNDKDFGELVFREKLPAYCIILFRFKIENPILKIQALKNIFTFPTEKIINHFIIISEGKIRIRPL